jgi:hypothetical protein
MISVVRLERSMVSFLRLKMSIFLNLFLVDGWDLPVAGERKATADSFAAE